MKAVRLLEYGGQLVFNDVPTPTIARDEILVKIRSTAVNHLDLVEASGTSRPPSFKTRNDRVCVSPPTRSKTASTFSRRTFSNCCFR